MLQEVSHLGLQPTGSHADVSRGKGCPWALPRFLHQHVCVDNLLKMKYTCTMKTTLTAKLKLNTMPEQFQALGQAQLAYRDSLNYASRYAYAHGKMRNKVAIQDGTYYEIRARYGLPAQMACSVSRQVGASYKTLWSKAKQNAAMRKAGQTKKRYKG